jgi:2-isopropylmalate synthase
VFLSSSEIHLAHQLHRDGDDVVAMASAAVARAKSYTADVEFSCMDATRSDPELIARLVRAAIAAGATTINLPDTVGCARPDQVAAMFREAYARVPELADVVASFHGQDDLGMATANSLAAISAGARQVELAVNGLGERAGNTAFEEVVMALRVHGAELGVATGVDTRGIWAVSQAVARHSGIGVPANKAIVGGNAFRHASGIHQDGVLKWRETYEALDPAEIGHPVGTEIVLGKLSGRAGFAARAQALGIDLPPAALERAFARFQTLADGRGEVGDAEVAALCRDPEAAGARASAAP